MPTATSDFFFSIIAWYYDDNDLAGVSLSEVQDA